MNNFRIMGRSLFVQGFNAMKQPWQGSDSVTDGMLIVWTRDRRLDRNSIHILMF